MIKFLLATSVIFNTLISLFNGLGAGQGIFKEQSAPQKLPLAPVNLQIQKAAVSALAESNPNFLPIRDWGIDDPEIKAKAALIFDLEKDRILYQRNINQVLPIASLTKLMTALVVLENIDIDEEAVISENAIAGYGDRGGLALDEKITIRNLLYILLMESSNDAAIALAEFTEEKIKRNFTDLMNEKAKELGLKNTYFIDPSGYDPGNVSTVNDISQLVEYSFNQPLIWQILKTPTIEVFSADRKIRHILINTDKLLNRLPNVIGGKTGYTEEAQGCLVLVIQEDQGRLISVVLGAEERFLETERLINWVKEAYQW